MPQFEGPAQQLFFNAKLSQHFGNGQYVPVHFTIMNLSSRIPTENWDAYLFLPTVFRPLQTDSAGDHVHTINAELS
jgi:hypothetical protein